MNNTINRRVLIKSLLLLLSSSGFSLANSNNHKKFTIIFGSCSNQNKRMDHWRTIINYEPDLLILLGDNVYGDFNNESANQLKQAYKKLSENSNFQYIKNNIPIISIWDDHDYGINDGGRNWEYKSIAKKLFLDFFSVNSNDVRYKRDGIYNSNDILLFNKKIKIVSLDTRYFKDDFILNQDRSLNKKYKIDYNKNKTILGKEQWKWLNNELKKEYDLLILLSSFQVLSTSHGWEKWSNIFYEREKLLKLLNKNRLSLILSGDRHLAGIYNYKNIYEITASSFNQRTFNNIEKDNLRVGELVNKNNFGIIELDRTNIEIKIIAAKRKTKEVFNSIKLKY
jgi:alkaline phosphatase D